MIVRRLVSSRSAKVERLSRIANVEGTPGSVVQPSRSSVSRAVFGKAKRFSITTAAPAAQCVFSTDMP